MGPGFANIGRRGIRLATFWLTVILVVVADQATKAAAVHSIEQKGVRSLIPGIVHLNLVENTGAAFSIGEGATLLFVVIAIAFLVAALLLVWREQDMPLPLVPPIAMVAGGGVGNMIDRVVKGSVTDFLAFSFVDFPVFNVADICVTGGIVLCVLGFWVWDRRNARHVAPSLSSLDVERKLRS